MSKSFCRNFVLLATAVLVVSGFFVVAQPVSADTVYGVTQITAVKTYAVPGGDYASGWSWVLNVTVPTTETILNMKFDNWTGILGNIPAATNLQFYSAQSSNAFDEAHAISTTAANTYSSEMDLIPTSDLSPRAGRQIQITIEARIPTGSLGGAYSTQFGIKTNPDTILPVITGTPANISVVATSSLGAVVTYTNPTATDNIDGTDPVTCLPISGATFPITTTQVACTATDSSNNTATSNFTVTVTPSIDATLSNIAISDGTLSPTFASTQLSYTDSVDNSVSSITVTPTANEVDATIKVNGVSVASGTASGSLALNVGSNTVLTVVTAQDGTTTGTYTITITRAKANQTITFGALADKTYGDAPFALAASASSGLPITFNVVSGPATWDGANLTLTGTGKVTVEASQPGNNDYNAASPVDQSFNVNPATVNVTASSDTMVYGGTPPTITAAYNPNIVPATTLADCSTLATSASPVGSYASSCTGASDPNYNFTYTPGSVSITQATPTITWATPADITYGTALSGTQLNATASVAGTFVYVPPSETILNTGNGQTLSVTFTPTDSTDYTTATKTVSVNVVKADQTILWDDPQDITYGTALNNVWTPSGGAQLNATISIPGPGPAGVLTYAPGNVVGTILPVGQHQPLTATAAATENYNEVTKIVYINVNPAPITINTPPTASAIAYGQTLASSILSGGSASVPGSFAFTTPTTAPIVGTALQGVTFIPTDATDYSTATTSVNVTVNPATVNVTASSDTMVYGGTVPTITAAYNPAIIPATLALCSTAATSASPVGSYTSSCTGASDPNYNFTYTAGSVSVTKATATVDLSNLAQTYSGSPESATATTTPPGLTVDLTYDSSSTVPTNAGSYAVVATINDLNYVGTASGTLVISPATSTVTIVCPTTAQSYTGSVIEPCTASYTTSDGLSGALTLTYSNNINVGTATATATYAGDANHSGSSNSATFTIVDTMAPTVALLGTGNNGNPSYAIVDTSYVDVGATCMDNVDGPFPATPSGTVNTSTIGIYTITYTCTDSSNNTATAARTVYVISANQKITIGNSAGGSISAVAATFSNPKYEITADADYYIADVKVDGVSVIYPTIVSGFAWITGNTDASYTFTNVIAPHTLSATFAPIPPVNGVCGSDNGQTLSAIPVNLCSAGIASIVSGTGPWTWTCEGENTGTTASCSADVQAPTPTLSFDTGITFGGTTVATTIANPITITTDGSATQSILNVNGTTATPNVVANDYGFNLVADAGQQTTLQNYFISKGLTGAMLTQIVNEISGASPFFYLSSDGTGNYSLVDGFQKALGAGDKPLVIDNDYPTGTYVYNGTLTGTNSAILPVTVTLVVAMQIPTPPSPTTYTVTFDANGGIPTPSAITGITSGATVTLPTAPTLAGNTFNGWFTAATGGTSFNGTTPVTANITVYAQWTPVVVILPTITIYTFNGVAGSVTVTSTTSNPVLINLTASENVNWMSIYVENISDSSIRREFTSGAGCVDGTSSCSKSWDGKDKSSGGNVLPNGDYHIKVHIKDAVNNEFNDYLTSQIITVSNP